MEKALAVGVPFGFGDLFFEKKCFNSKWSLLAWTRDRRGSDSILVDRLESHIAPTTTTLTPKCDEGFHPTLVLFFHSNGINGCFQLGEKSLPSKQVGLESPELEGHSLIWNSHKLPLSYQLQVGRNWRKRMIVNLPQCLVATWDLGCVLKRRSIRDFERNVVSCPILLVTQMAIHNHFL